MDVSILQLTYQSFINSSHASVRLLCVDSLDTTQVTLAALLDEASAQSFVEDKLTTDGQSWIGEDMTQVQVLKTLNTLRRRGWKILSHDVVSAQSEQDPGLTILVRTFYFEKVGEIRAFRAFADEGQDEYAAAGVGPAAHAANAIDRDGAAMLQGTAPQQQPPLYQQQAEAEQHIETALEQHEEAAPAVEATAHGEPAREQYAETAPAVEAVAHQPDPASTPASAQPDAATDRDAEWFAERRLDEKLKAQRRQAELDAMDPEEREAVLEQEQQAILHEQNKARHYTKLGRVSTSGKNRKAMLTGGRGGRGRGRRGGKA